jgi:hypothetical protein
MAGLFRRSTILEDPFPSAPSRNLERISRLNRTSHAMCSAPFAPQSLRVLCYHPTAWEPECPIDSSALDTLAVPAGVTSPTYVPG